MSASLFMAIGEACNRVAHHSPLKGISSQEEYVDFCQRAYSLMQNSPHFNLDDAARLDEFHSFGIVGGPNGHLMAPMIWSVARYPDVFGRMVNAQSVFVSGNPAELTVCASVFPTVYTVNSLSTYLISELVDTSELTNINTISYSQIMQDMPKVDFAYVVSSLVITRDFLLYPLLSSINPGGLFVLTNSSGGGDLYSVNNQSTLSDELHSKIRDTGDFTMIHLQGYISYTLCLKNS